MFRITSIIMLLGAAVVFLICWLTLPAEPWAPQAERRAGRPAAAEGGGQRQEGQLSGRQPPGPGRSARQAALRVWSLPRSAFR